MNVVHSGSREHQAQLFFFDASLPSRALLLLQPPFQFLLRLAIAARSEQLGCQSAISCLVPPCEIILRDCATNILLCCNYLYWLKVNHALCCLFATGNIWQTWPRKRWMLSLCIYAHMQHVGMLLCGNPDPGPEEQGCCLCVFGNMWECYYVAILILVQKKRDVVFVHLAICGKKTVRQSWSRRREMPFI